MSRTQNDPGDKSNNPKDAYLELSRMLREGRSWSGRERNCAFLNTRDGRFANVSASSGFDFPDDARAIALVDWDQDGDQDLWVSNRNAPRLRFLRNETQGGTSVAFRLAGNGTTTNAGAVGARVEIETAGPGPSRQIRTLRAGEGYLAQSSQWVHFGLGAAREVTRVRVRWPAGTAEEFSGVKAPGRYRLVEGTGKAEPVAPRSTAPSLNPTTPARPVESSVARVPLLTLLQLPRGLTYERFDGSGTAPIEAREGRPLLVNLFASWCQPCAEELRQLAKDAVAIRAARLDVIALAVDGLGDDRSDPARAAQLVAGLKSPFSSGRATRAALTVFQQLNDTHVPLHKPLPVPSSLLIDAAGRLSVIYKGPVGVQQVLTDLQHSSGSLRERWLRSAPLGGTALDHPAIDEAMRLSEVSQRFICAVGLTEQGRLDDARAQYTDILALKPDFTEAQVNLGLLSLRSGDLIQAERCYRAALELRPDSPDAHYNLGALRDRQGDFAVAEAEYRETLRLRPEYPEAHNALGLLNAKAGRLAEARAHFELETRNNPSFAEGHNNLGLVHLNESRDAEALQCFDVALRLDPKHADAHNNRGILLKRQGRLDDAADEYRKAIASSPRFAQAHNNLGAVLRSQGRIAEARAEFEKALEIEPGFQSARQNLERLEAAKR